MNSIEKQREKLQQVARKYKLDRPISVEGKKIALASKKKIYVGLLKNLGKYSSFMGLVIFIQYILKKVGVTIVLNKAIVIAVISATAVVGGYYTAYYIYTQSENKITSIKSSHNEIILTDQVKKTEFMVFSYHKNKTIKNITSEIKIDLKPKGLLTIEKQKEKIIVTAEKNGSAIITVFYDNYHDIIHVISKVTQADMKKEFIITEKVYLKDGNIFLGQLIKDNDFYILVMSDKRIKIHKDEIAKIEYIK